jgi:hypothetical protein
MTEVTPITLAHLIREQKRQGEATRLLICKVADHFEERLNEFCGVYDRNTAMLEQRLIDLDGGCEAEILLRNIESTIDEIAEAVQENNK